MTATFDGAKALAEVSGLSRGEVLDIWEQVKANSAALNACPRHSFERRTAKLGEKLTCISCGGTMGLTEIGWYIRGYEAAGGSADHIWPGFRGAKP